jgi:hypothetical protein
MSECTLCILCGPVSHNQVDFEISYGALDCLLRVCRYCREDLELLGFRHNQVIRLLRVRIPVISLCEILGPVFSALNVKGFGVLEVTA